MKRLFRIMLILVTALGLLLGMAISVYAQEPGPGIDLGGLLEAISPYVQAILEIVLVALFSVAAFYVKQYLTQLVLRLRQNVTYEQFVIIRAVIDQLVAAAEQVYKDAGGEEKKQYVLDQAQKALAEYGLTLDLQTLDALVEAAVYDQFNRPPPIWPEEVTILPVDENG